MGIDKETKVVVYSNRTTAGARLVWAVLYADVENVRFLNGVYEAWLSACYKGITETTFKTSVSYFGADTALHQKCLVDTNYVGSWYEWSMGLMLTSTQLKPVELTVRTLM
ncbi:MAG: hypothetical protein SWO11_10130 [Thermodesulfobacteriota bacterium]|nr:hypothetical protein [Thermodesulfobacteriota bacterium]